jgi:hypothetical protein
MQRYAIGKRENLGGLRNAGLGKYPGIVLQIFIYNFPQLGNYCSVLGHVPMSAMRAMQYWLAVQQNGCTYVSAG